jgi:hypothetical protein
MIKEDTSNVFVPKDGAGRHGKSGIGFEEDLDELSACEKSSI